MSTWKEETRHVDYTAEAHAFVFRHWKVTLLMGIFCLVDAAGSLALLDSRDPSDAAAFNILLSLVMLPAAIGCFHVTASARPQEYFFRRVYGYGLSRLFVSLLALLPFFVVWLLGFLAIAFPLTLLTRSVAGSVFALVFGFINPWALRLSMVVPVMAVHDIPFGGAIGRTWRASKGHASGIFFGCYLPLFLMWLVNMLLAFLVGGFDQPKDGQVAAILVCLPLGIYSNSFWIGAMVSLAHAVMNTGNAKATESPAVANPAR